MRWIFYMLRVFLRRNETAQRVMYAVRVVLYTIDAITGVILVILLWVVTVIPSILYVLACRRDELANMGWSEKTMTLVLAPGAVFGPIMPELP